MNELVYINVVDKSGWGEGPWSNEPDKVQWTDPATGLACLAVRGPIGAWCGYVGVEPDHPFYGLDYDEVNVGGAHGGLTFNGTCDHGPPDSSICHIPEEGKPDAVWWFGFDCSHYGDFVPELAKFRERSYAHTTVYRDLNYVKASVTELAAQLFLAGKKNERAG